MEYERLKPKIDKLFHCIWIPTTLLLIGATVLAAFDTLALLIVIPVDLIVVYFIITPLFGYVELREDTLFIRFGFFMTREIPYKRIRGAVIARKFYSDSMLSLKNSFDHVNIKYNTFDILSVSVEDNEAFAEMLNGINKQ